MREVLVPRALDNADRMKEKIERALCMPMPSHRIAVDGARATSAHIRAVIG